MKRSELFMACANEYSYSYPELRYRCNSDCDNCQLYLRYLKEKED
nr:MAG TPA: Radical SAM superfamily [Caudoviricetes sp.]